ncbi:MAG: RtcB family protein [Hyphomicrobiales bacterium]|nr:RtcB family protein [Hyphomicrobiales bacterium]
MEPRKFVQVSDTEWRVEPFGSMRVPAIIYADRALIEEMDDKVFDQVTNVATLPGIVRASYAMPDAHWGYGFPIGGVAAFNAEEDGVISVGGVGFDISCGVRAMLSDLSVADLEPHKPALAEALFATVPAGLGSRGDIRLDDAEMTAMLSGGAAWALERGWGEAADLMRIEEHGRMPGARPDFVSERARKRQRREMGTLGSGNHYLEVQEVAEIFDEGIAESFGLTKGRVILCIHCGSRGLGHQIGTEYMKDMAVAAAEQGIALPDRELACARITSPIGQRYLGAMRAGINCALANRQIIGHLARTALDRAIPGAKLTLLYDVSHNTCKEERHRIDGEVRDVFIHRKGATRAFGPGHPDLPQGLKACGQPVLIGGSMGTGSYVLAGTKESEEKAFSSACHGAGRRMSRHQAYRTWKGRQVVDELADRGILVRSPSMRGIAEEAPGAYKDVGAVVDAAEAAGLARKVARLKPLICIKG